MRGTKNHGDNIYVFGMLWFIWLISFTRTSMSINHKVWQSQACGSITCSSNHSISLQMFRQTKINVWFLFFYLPNFSPPTLNNLWMFCNFSLETHKPYGKPSIRCKIILQTKSLPTCIYPQFHRIGIELVLFELELELNKVKVRIGIKLGKTRPDFYTEIYN